jgi:hypothetical protein
MRGSWPTGEKLNQKKEKMKDLWIVAPEALERNVTVRH